MQVEDRDASGEGSVPRVVVGPEGKALGICFQYPRLGDSIVVPEQFDRIAWLREIKDITQIIFQIAVTAGVLIVAF